MNTLVMLCTFHSHLNVCDENHCPTANRKLILKCIPEHRYVLHSILQIQLQWKIKSDYSNKGKMRPQ